MSNLSRSYSSDGASPAAPGIPGFPASGQLNTARILIVDDEPANVRVLERLLIRAGALNFRSTTDSRQALPLLLEFAPDIVLLDLHMPHLNGFAVLDQIRSMDEAGSFLPVVILTADATSQTRLNSLERGATDFLTKPFDHAEVLLRVRNLLHTRRLHQELAEHNLHLEETVKARTADLRQALQEVQEMQGHLVQQERLSAFGTMASGVAHDFNNTLSLILGYSELLLADDERLSPDERRQFVRTVITAAKDSARMVSRLREFYRPNDEREVWEHVDLARLVKEAVALTEPKWKGQCEGQGRSISVTCDLSPVSPISGNAAELREMFTNLIFNAVDAMPTGGNILLRVREEAGEVLTEVADTGTGMSDEVRQRCLEPFFTTKGEKGTGLGLAMVYGIAQRHRANLQLESQAGVGTVFRFRFPVETSAPVTAQTEEVRLAQTLKILVVDDQPFICEIMEQYLAQDAHEAHSACSAADALACLGKEKYDLMITDQAMPDLSGTQLARKARELQPELRVILLTGFGTEERPEDEAGVFDMVVGKPVSLETLRQSLAAVFHGTAAAPRRDDE